MTLTVHYRTSDFEHRYFLLNIHFVSKSHTSENLYDGIEDGPRDWNLNGVNRPIFIVTVVNNTWERIPCFAHTLQLASKDALHDTVGFDSIRKKCRKLVGFCARSSTAHAKLDDMQRSLNPDAPSLRLIQDVETRWNLEFAMFQRLLELRTAFGADLSLWKMPTGLSNEEWNIIQMYSDVLGPFKEATVIMFGEKYPTLPLYIPLTKGLIKKITLKKTKRKKQ